MPRPKVPSSRSTPRLSTRSQQQSPPRGMVWMTISKQQQCLTTGTRDQVSDNDNDSICSSSKSSDVIVTRPSVAKVKPKDETGSGKVAAPWRHPDELDYFRPYDWSEDKIISQLRATVFTVPRPVNGKQAFIEITLFDDGDFDKPRPVKVPRGYRVPLMFVAKFQWASLKLVLTSGQREKEWSDYKFDILHLSRLCARFFEEAGEACGAGIVEVPPVKNAQVPEKAMSRKWRCPTFDRALARYNKNWLISREEFVRDFYIEFEDEEYVKDVLKIDWSRWALKGHKGFKLAQDELKNGIDARMVIRGLKKDDGRWVWVDDYLIKQEEVAAVSLSSEDKVITTGENEEANTLPPPPADELVSRTIGQAPAPEPLPITTPPRIQQPSTPPKFSRHASDATSEHTATRQPSPFVEKFHSPLSSLPSSASPSVAPAQTFDQQHDGGHQSAPAPPPASSPIPRRSPTNRTGTESLPQLIIPSTPKLSVQATPPPDGTQLPKSKSPLITSSPEVKTQCIESIAGTSPLTPINPDTSLGERCYATVVNQQTEPDEPRKLSPTSIDSTPTPSPAVQPLATVDFIQSEENPVLDTVTTGRVATTFHVSQPNGTLSNDSDDRRPSEGDRSLERDIRPIKVEPSSTSESLMGTGDPLHGLVPVHRTNEPETHETPQDENQHHSPVLPSALPPPLGHTRSPSLDEIPGLGELSFRRPLSLPLHFVAPKMTARTVTDGSSWQGLDDSFTKPKIEAIEPCLPMAIDEGEQVGVDGAKILSSRGGSILSQIANEPATTQLPISELRPPDDDDDSDMDFGTPEMSPVILVPGCQVDDFEIIPPLTLPRDPDRPSHLTEGIPKRNSSTSTRAARMKAIHAPIIRTLRVGSTARVEQPVPSQLDRIVHDSSDNGLDCSIPALDGPDESTDLSPNNTLGCSDSVPPDNPTHSRPVSLSRQLPAPEPVVQVAPSEPMPTFPGSEPRSVENASLTSTNPSVDNHTPSLPSILSRPQPDENPASSSRTQSFVAPVGGAKRFQLQGVEHGSSSRWSRPQSGALDVGTTQSFFQSPHHQNSLPTHSIFSQIVPYTNDPSYDPPQGQSSTPRATSMSRKRPREGKLDDDDDDEAPKSRKRKDGLSIREGGIVVRKVVSMVRDTLSGLNDLLELAVEQDLIPSDHSRGNGKGKERAADLPVMDESPLYSPATPSPVTRTPVLPHFQVDTPEVSRLSKELQSLKAEMVLLKERSTNDALDTGEPDHVRAMRKELDMLREQVRVLKEARRPPVETLEIQTMRDELSTLRNDVRSLQDISRRSSAPSTPSTPNITLRFNSHAMAHTVHPLAHLLTAEPDTPSPTTSNINSQPSQLQADINDPQSGPSRQRPSAHAEAPETQKEAAQVPRPPFFDDIPLPVKSKRKAKHRLFSRC